MTEAFCVRCRKKVLMEEEHTVQYRNKRWAVKGICPECGGKVNKTIPRKKSFIERLFPTPKKKKEEEYSESQGGGQPAPE